METMTTDVETSETAPATVPFVSVEAGPFAAVIGNALLFASTDAARPILTGVLVEPASSTDVGAEEPAKPAKADALRFVATDSYAIGWEVLAVANAGAWPAGGLLLDGKGLADVAKAAKAAQRGRRSGFVAVSAQPSEDGRTVEFTVDAVRIAVRVIDGEFPRWRQLDPVGEFPNAAPVGMSTAMLTRLGKIRGRDGKPCNLRITVTDSLKPTRFEVVGGGAGGHWCRGLAMPTRLG